MCPLIMKSVRVFGDFTPINFLLFDTEGIVGFIGMHFSRLCCVLVMLLLNFIFVDLQINQTDKKVWLLVHNVYLV